MRVLLDAYFDNNFGDDLFVDTLLARYPEAVFYVFWKKAPARVRKRAEKFRNLVFLPENCELKERRIFDAYVMVGGDILPDGIDYSERISMMEAVKEGGGFVAMLGFSLYASYGEGTIRDFARMAELADAIVIRDRASVERYRSFAPDAPIVEGTDMSFVRTASAPETSVERETDVMGIAARRRLYSSEEEYQRYCNSMARIAEAYLAENKNAAVRFLAFSCGEYDDRQTASDIVDKMKTTERVQISAYEGDIEEFKQRIGECSVMIPTRFHGLVFALKNRIPFVPIPYEAKVTQLLEELGYEGETIEYGAQISAEDAEKTIKSIKDFPIATERLANYEEKASVFFDALDHFVKTGARKSSCEEESGVFLCNAGRAAKTLIAENDMLKMQLEELNKWVEALKEERKAFEQRNIMLEEMRKSQHRLREAAESRNQELEIQNKALEDHNEMLLQWVESLKAERLAFERQNTELEEIRSWEWNKLQEKVLNRAKLQQQYDEFVTQLRGKLDEKYSEGV